MSIYYLGAPNMPDTLSPQDLRKLLDYNPETGVLTWKRREGARHAGFNTRFAGKPAGYIDTSRKDGHRYVTVRLNYRLYFAHRVCWAIHYGEWPGENYQIDHIDSNCTNNAINNLRLVTHRGNGMNIRRKKNNKSGVTGVWRNPHGYVAEIMVNRKKISLGSYRTLEEAKEARLSAEKRFGFHPLHGKKTATYN